MLHLIRPLLSEFAIYIIKYYLLSLVSFGYISLDMYIRMIIEIKMS